MGRERVHSIPCLGKAASTDLPTVRHPRRWRPHAPSAVNADADAGAGAGAGAGAPLPGQQQEGQQEEAHPPQRPPSRQRHRPHPALAVVGVDAAHGRD